MHLSDVRRGTAEALKPNIGPCLSLYWCGLKRRALPKRSQPCLTWEWTKISDGLKTNLKLTVYLIDTNVISEARKKANIGVQRFFKQVVEDKSRVFISVVTRNHKDFVKTGVPVLNPWL